MANIIETLEKEEIARLGKKIPKFAPGDTVAVGVNVIEGTRSRVQFFEGIVISRRNRGLNSSFIVRKISSGEGVERTFQLHSPLIDSISVKRRGDVKRAKLFYLRDLAGNKKAAMPKNYFPNDNIGLSPENRWRSHAHIIFGNWINEMYQTTPFNIEEIG